MDTLQSWIEAWAPSSTLGWIELCFERVVLVLAFAKLYDMYHTVRRWRNEREDQETLRTMRLLRKLDGVNLNLRPSLHPISE
jgi:hypothetical protein